MARSRPTSPISRSSVPPSTSPIWRPRSIPNSAPCGPICGSAAGRASTRSCSPTFDQWQDDIVAAHGSGAMPIRYLVLGSRFPGVFSLGGDLDLFATHIRRGDRDALVRYGRACVADPPPQHAQPRTADHHHRPGRGRRAGRRVRGPAVVQRRHRRARHAVSACPKPISGCFRGWGRIASCRGGSVRRGPSR